MDRGGMYYRGLFFNIEVMEKRLYIVLFLLSMVLSTISGQGINEGQVRQKINQTASALKSLKCDFVQTKHLKLLNDKLVSTGKMYYQKSDKLRWEYMSPYTYTFILNADKVLLKNQKRNDVIDVNQNKMFKEIARIMMNSVVGNSLTDDKNFKTAITATSTEWIATLLPLRKDMKQMFQKIILHFNKQKSMVTQVELYEKNGDKTLIELKNAVLNETIDAKMFAIH